MVSAGLMMMTTLTTLTTLTTPLSTPCPPLTKHPFSRATPLSLIIHLSPLATHHPPLTTFDPSPITQFSLLATSYLLDPTVSALQVADRERTPSAPAVYRARGVNRGSVRTGRERARVRTYSVYSYAHEDERMPSPRRPRVDPGVCGMWGFACFICKGA